ncbi:MAG: hypothetical protein GKR96_11455 [Gammaproteobacteria bacterium]|nr:hypothetical protein [Gammaproteobacteria bacterium]
MSVSIGVLPKNCGSTRVRRKKIYYLSWSKKQRRFASGPEFDIFSNREGDGLPALEEICLDNF